MSYGGGGVRIDLRPIASLLPHEETIDSKTREMVLQLRKDGVQKDPMIVDGDSGVVLDGMHRLGAFAELGIKYAACDLVRYGSPKISLGRWLRVYRSPESADPAEFLEEAGLTESSPVSDALRRLKRRGTPAAAFLAGKAYLPAATGEINEWFAIVRKADRAAEAHRWERSFAGEEELGVHLRAKGEVVLMVFRFGKRDVLEAGTARRPFPCKTSMHAVDPRPVALNMPLDELERGSRDALEQRLNRNRFRLLPPDSVYEGRRYKERLLLLNRG